MNDEQNKSEEKEVLKTFDMYHFFSRKDVILAIILIVALVGYAVFRAVFVPQVV